MVTEIVKRSLRAIVPCACCFAALVYIGWRISCGSGELRPGKDYKVDIVVKGPDGKVIPAVGRAPK
jgi:hypothetical protein